MGADLGALLHHHDGNIRIDLLEADGGTKSGRPGADNHHVEFHRLAGGQVSHGAAYPNSGPFCHHFCTVAAIACARCANIYL